MRGWLCGVLALWLLGSTPAMAEVRKDRIQLKDNHPQEYVVVKGDTLWDISARFLQTPWRWPDVWSWNPQIDNPHLIYPGDRIYLTWVDGKPQLRLQRGMRKLSPKARVTPLERAIPTIPLREIVSFLNNNRVETDEKVKHAPYVLAGTDQRILAGAGDRVYVRGELISDVPRQALYRPSEEYRDPLTDELLGYELLKVADGTVAAQQDDVVSVDLTGSEREVRVMDRLLPVEESRVEAVFHPAPMPALENGRLLSVLGGVNDGGQFDVVALNKGLREGLEPGHVAAIYRSGEQIVDPVTNDLVQLPSERSGLLMVFRVFDKVSYGLVLESSNVVSVGDEFRVPD
ncbi:LysM peptidoglycan-binding domain-containing protein [Marinobacterium arenosum]|uniref:LysM peptidoglycan-binding domain-containing protein n=1 Tax=Marinobacterium arenosum TaxID=2862496 RepID=UPI001C97FB0D|nr:LysM peptidoglycan-binding domain-containing protein [Marinobacterium arenosum]MBY4677731.1 LysM peptidoglycan-binding domain-containing protein [Marinobacterium arenosum]